jgi:hypothetical protein
LNGPLHKCPSVYPRVTNQRRPNIAVGWELGGTRSGRLWSIGFIPRLCRIRRLRDVNARSLVWSSRLEGWVRRNFGQFR